MNPCACVGPIGNCPCIQQARGEKCPITEFYIAPALFDLLSDEDKSTINSLKMKALALRLQGESKPESVLADYRDTR